MEAKIKVKEPESISSLVQEIKKTDQAKADLQSSSLSINVQFKTRAEKIMWLADELQREAAMHFNEGTKTRKG